MKFVRSPIEDKLPALVSLKLLTQQGYTTGRPPQIHSIADTDKTYGEISKDFSLRRHYLQCLVNLQAVCAKGLPGLRSDQCDLYYKLVLSSTNPASIPLGESTVALRRLMDKNGDEAPRAIEDKHVQAIEDGAVDKPPTEVPQISSPQCGSSFRRRKCLSITNDDSDDGNHDSGSLKAGCVALPNSVIIEGSRVQIETHLEPLDPGFYKRCIVFCPLYNSVHWSPDGHPCRKKRNIDISKGVDGVKSALAFCGVWVRRGAQCEARDPHMRFRPSQQDIDNYLECNPIPERDILAVMQ